MSTDLKRLIEKKYLEAHFDDKDKNLAGFLLSSLTALADHIENISGQLENRLVEELQAKKSDWEKSWTVATVLVPQKNVATMLNFFEVHDDADSVFFRHDPESPDLSETPDEDNARPPVGPFFLHCAYEDFTSYCRRPYRGKLVKQQRDFTWEFVPQYRLVEQERILFELAELYGIQRPVIFSPYARRAVDLHILDMDEPLEGENFDFANFDFAWKENGLEEVVRINHTLMWNVNLPKEEYASSSSTAPNQKCKQYTYYYTDGVNDTTFILPILPFGIGLDQIEYKKYPQQIHILCPQSLKGTCRKADIYPIDPENLASLQRKYTIFQNIYHPADTLIKKERLRTAADVNFVLKTLKQDGFSAEFDGLKENEDAPVLRFYEQRHKYYSKPDEKFQMSLRQRPVCRVRFAGDEMFLTDYANFVLHYLQQLYPEYLWIGVR